jgi:hypothetical protein
VSITDEYSSEADGSSDEPFVRRLKCLHRRVRCSPRGLTRRSPASRASGRCRQVQRLVRLHVEC